MNFNYYYNNVPGKGLCRNNLIYTSLISSDKKTFCQWYHNDKIYHYGENKVVDESLMIEKWSREIRFLTRMSENYPHLIPEIQDIDYKNKKIFLKIDGNDFWEASEHSSKNYQVVLSNWEDQLLEIIKAHEQLGIYKYSLHPSSYFVVNNQLKSINYFFCYDFNEQDLELQEVFSHISDERLQKLYPIMNMLEIDPYQKTSLAKIQNLAFETFKSDFPSTTMNTAKNIYV